MIFYDELYRVLNEWMYLRDEGKKISDCLLDRNIRIIAIYGMGDCAIHLINELYGSEVTVECLLTDGEDEYDVSVPVFITGAELPPVDAIVYTDSLLEKEKLELLSKKYNCSVISLAEVVYGLI